MVLLLILLSLGIVDWISGFLPFGFACFCYLVSLDCCVGRGYILSVVNSVVHVRALVVSFAMFWFNMMCLVSLCLLLGCCGVMVVVVVCCYCLYSGLVLGDPLS